MGFCSLVFLFAAFQLALLPWENSRDGALGAPRSPKPGNFRGTEGKRGLSGKEVPRSAHKKQISCCCPGSPAHISSLTGSAARLRVTSRCFHSPHGSCEGAYCTGMGITAGGRVGDRPCHDGKGGSIGPPAPPRIPAWPHPAPPHPDAGRSLLLLPVCGPRCCLQPASHCPGDELEAEPVLG